jgi:glutamate racemase
MLVVACNTATVHAVDMLRNMLPDIPVVGVEPGVKPAAQSTQTGRIAVLATEATAYSERLRYLIETHASHLKVYVQACPGWATSIENLNLNNEQLAADIHTKVQPLLDAQVDRVVLGCTHYTFLAPLLMPLLQDRAELVDVAEAVARQVARLDGRAHGKSRLRLIATAYPEHLYAALPALSLAWLAAKTSGAEMADV